MPDTTIVVTEELRDQVNAIIHALHTLTDNADLPEEYWQEIREGVDAMSDVSKAFNI